MTAGNLGYGRGPEGGLFSLFVSILRCQQIFGVTKFPFWVNSTPCAFLPRPRIDHPLTDTRREPIPSLLFYSKPPTVHRRAPPWQVVFYIVQRLLYPHRENPSTCDISVPFDWMTQSKISIPKGEIRSSRSQMIPISSILSWLSSETAERTQQPCK